MSENEGAPGIRVAHRFSFLCWVAVCLYSSCVLCAQCCKCLWFVHWWSSLRFSLTFFYLSVDYCDLALWTVQLLQSRHYWKTWFSLVSAKLFTWRSTTITDIRLPIPFIRMFCTILLWFVAIYYLHTIQFTKKQSINHGGFNIIGFCNVNQHFLLSVESCVIREN